MPHCISYWARLVCAYDPTCPPRQDQLKKKSDLLFLSDKLSELEIERQRRAKTINLNLKDSWTLRRVTLEVDNVPIWKRHAVMEETICLHGVMSWTRVLGVERTIKK